MVICDVCGMQQAKPNAKFCGSCGAPLTGQGHIGQVANAAPVMGQAQMPVAQQSAPMMEQPQAPATQQSAPMVDSVTTTPAPAQAAQNGFAAPACQPVANPQVAPNPQQAIPNPQPVTPNPQQAAPNAGQAPSQPSGQPQGDPNQGQNTVSIDMGKDCTSQFSAEDISQNKVFAIGSYLLGFLGIIVALLAARESKFAMFHARESMKIIVVQLLLGLFSMVLVWTLIVPVLALVGWIILLVVQIICIIRVCKGQAKKAPIVGSFKFLE